MVLTHSYRCILSILEVKQGIYLELWYKNDEFGQPKIFDTPWKLLQHLHEQITEGFKIRVMVVDCTKRLSPSNPARILKNPVDLVAVAVDTNDRSSMEMQA